MCGLERPGPLFFKGCKSYAGLVLKCSTEAVGTVASNFSPWGNHTDPREDREVYQRNELLHDEKRWLVSSLAEL